MRIHRLIALWLTFVLGSVCVDSTQARPKYTARYEAVFKDENAESKKGKIDCTLCHEGNDKKKRNDYAKKLADELGEKNVMDEDKIDKALKAIGPHPSHKKKNPEPKPEPGPGPDPPPKDSERTVERAPL